MSQPGESLCAHSDYLIGAFGAFLPRARHAILLEIKPPPLKSAVTGPDVPIKLRFQCPDRWRSVRA